MRNQKNSKNIVRLFLYNIIIVVLVFSGFYFMKGTNKIVDVEAVAVNVHADPSANSKVITQIHQEDRVTIKEKKDDWYKIQTSSKTEGWVPSWLIFDGTSSPYTYLPALINSRSVELKSDNNKSSETIKKLKKKQKVFVTMALNGWCRVYTDGDYGWIPTESLSIRKAQQTKFDEGATLNITLDNTPVYSSNSETSDILTTLNYDDQVTFVQKDDGDWDQIKTSDGQTGFVRSWTITNNPLEDITDRPDEPKSDYTIVLDPGHGGSDSGAQSNDGSVYEKNLTLATAKVVKKELEEKGYNVLMTRSSDEFVALADIAKFSNDNHADAFVSLHYDSSDVANEASGTTVFYQNESGYPLAEAINDKVETILPLDNRGVEVADYQVLRDNKQPAVLIELGYINNDYDLTYAQSKKYYKKVAKAIDEGITDYLDEQKKESSQ